MRLTRGAPAADLAAPAHLLDHRPGKHMLQIAEA